MVSVERVDAGGGAGGDERRSGGRLEAEKEIVPGMTKRIPPLRCGMTTKRGAQRPQTKVWRDRERGVRRYGEADDWVWGGADCAGSVGILWDGKFAPDRADSGILWAGAGGVRGTGADGEREAANAVDACCGDGGAAGISGGGIAGGSGVYQGARRAADGYGGGCGEVPGGDGGGVHSLCGAVRAVVYCGAAGRKAGGGGGGGRKRG